jgi:hypothetical protein
MTIKYKMLRALEKLIVMLIILTNYGYLKDLKWLSIAGFKSGLSFKEIISKLYDFFNKLVFDEFRFNKFNKFLLNIYWAYAGYLARLKFKKYSEMLKEVGISQK